MAALITLLAGSAAAFAQSADGPSPANGPQTQDLPRAQTGTFPDACASKTDVLGVSRVVEIDTTGGPRFGEQYKDVDPLADKEVVLTFDDGPARRYTLPVLDALDAECTKATFFAVGRMALADPEMLKETARRGHTIGTHSWSHRRLHEIGKAKAKDEIELGISAVSRALGQPAAPFFRFPYLGDSKALIGELAGRNQGIFGIDVDSRDFSTRNPAVVRSRVMAQLKAKGRGIILFHDIQPSTAGAIPTLLKELKKGGYKVVHLVAKAPSETLPVYDTMAQKEAARRKVALSSQPLADRSIVWPVSPGVSPGVSPDASKPASVAGEDLPWSAKPDNGQSPAPTAQPAVKPRLRPSIEDDWAVRPLGR